MKKLMKFSLPLVALMSLVSCSNQGIIHSRSNSGITSSSSQSSRKGSLTIAIPMVDEEKQVLEAVANEYKKINPRVNISIDSSGASGTYYDRLNSILSNDDMSKVTVDIVRNNMSSQYFGSNKFVDISQYLNKKNPYAENQLWKDTFEDIALTPNGSRGELYSLNFKSTQVSFFYNKDIFADCGIDVKDLETWSGFKASCQKIVDKYPDGSIFPLAIDGSASSFWSGQMSWLFRVYVDQYFRDLTEEVHTRNGDWNYDPYVDKNWKYGVYPSDYPELSPSEANYSAWFNDVPQIYNQNPLRTLQGIKQGYYGPNSMRYKNMLANLCDVFPRYCGNSFSSDKSNFFWTGKAAIALDETSLLVQWKNKKEISPDTMFDVGYFNFPSMETHPDYNDSNNQGAPSCDYARSIGGPHGYYGIINKSSEQTDLVIDFMMFWASKKGQEIEMAKMEELGIALKGKPYIKGLTIPPSIDLASDMVLKGIADNNPATLFARGLADEALSTRDFQNNCQALFNLHNITIDTFASNMQTSMQNNLPNYIKSRGYRGNCLDNGNVTVNPF